MFTVEITIKAASEEEECFIFPVNGSFEDTTNILKEVADTLGKKGFDVQDVQHYKYITPAMLSNKEYSA